MERTPEELKRIHVALEHAGSLGGAASLLGMDTSTMRNIVSGHPELRSYLPRAQPPSDVELLARKPLTVPVVKQQDIVAAVKAADDQVREGFEAIGVIGDALKEALAFRDFGRLHFNDMRGTAVTLLAEARCTPQQICAITGHTLQSATRILERYLAMTDALSSAAIHLFENAPETVFANRLQTRSETPLKALKKN